MMCLSHESFWKVQFPRLIEVEKNRLTSRYRDELGTSRHVHLGHRNHAKTHQQLLVSHHHTFNINRHLSASFLEHQKISNITFKQSVPQNKHVWDPPLLSLCKHLFSAKHARAYRRESFKSKASSKPI